jgi:hypothetical protein
MDWDITLHIMDDFKLCAFILSCITDSASNMISLGAMLGRWRDAPHLRHYYCSDHILQLTAVQAYSGNVTIDVGNDNSVAVIKKARNLVSHVNSSVVASEKIKSAQLALSPNCTPLKLVSDCETRWWSTQALVGHLLKLQEPLQYVFEDEFCLRERPQNLTLLETYELSDEDFTLLGGILYLLTPFKDAQKALQGKLYANFSLLPLIIAELKNQIVTCQGAGDPVEQGQLLNLITDMLSEQKEICKKAYLHFPFGPWLWILAPKRGFLCSKQKRTSSNCGKMLHLLSWTLLCNQIIMCNQIIITMVALMQDQYWISLLLLLLVGQRENIIKDIALFQTLAMRKTRNK